MAGDRGDNAPPVYEDVPLVFREPDCSRCGAETGFDGTSRWCENCGMEWTAEGKPVRQSGSRGGSDAR